jgi:endo-1,4-beta-xylanase
VAFSRRRFDCLFIMTFITRMFRTFLFVAALAVATSTGRPALELLRNGNFAQPVTTGAELPGGWESGGSGGVVRWQAIDGQLWLSTDGQSQSPAVFQEADLPERLPSAVRLSGEVKLEDVERGERTWYSGRMLVTYLDGQGQVLGETYTLDRLEGTADWRAVRRQFPVPADARRVRVELQLLQPKAGSIGFRGVSLQALDETEAQAWRVDAEARIRGHRMAPLRLRVEDAHGRPVPDAEIAVFMRRHAYPFGTAAQARLLTAAPGDRQTDVYRSVVENFFNYVTLENDLKARTVEKNGVEPAVKALAWLKEHGIAMRGHVLTWPSFNMATKAELAAKDDPGALRAVMREEFRVRLDAVAPYGIADWDVVNEPAIHNDLIRILGDGQVAEWFRWAAEDAPKARLFLNENNVEFAGGNRDSLEQWIRRLQAAGAPLGGLGWQGHMWHRTLPSGQNILDDLDYFAPYGLPVQITEYDTHERFTDEDDARFMDEFLTAWFSHPLTAGFIMWGFQDAYMWNGNGPLFRADWSLKPSGKVWMQKVFGDWWTETRGRGDENGSYQVRGFLGDYEVEAVQGGRRATGKVTLSAEGGERVLRLPAGGGVTERLVSSNPYTAGKLPEVISVAAGPAVDFETLAINPKDGQGLMAWSPGEAGQNRSVSRDMYARFNSAAWAGKRVEQASLRIRIGKTAEASSRVKIFVLSNRFVPQDGEAGLGWTADDLELGRAPGRDARDGDYRLGDAAVIYLGDMPANDADGDGWLTFSSTGLTLAAAQAGLPGLTVIVSNPVDHLPAQEVQLLLRTGKGR